MAATYFEGTVLPAGDTLDVEKAAERLRKAMKGLGTDEKAIIDVLSGHCNVERQLIRSMYKTMYGRDLIEDLQDELSGHFETLCLYFLMPSRNFDAHCLHLAMKGLGTKESTLIEILVSRTSSELEEIRENYKKNYGNELEADIKGETHGDLDRVLVSLLQGQRSQEPEVDMKLVKTDADDLYNAGKGNRLGTDEAIFNKILVTRSVGHLREVFQEYEKLDDKGIEGAVSDETSGNLKRAFLAIDTVITEWTSTCIAANGVGFRGLFLKAVVMLGRSQLRRRRMQGLGEWNKTAISVTVAFSPLLEANATDSVRNASPYITVIKHKGHRVTTSDSSRESSVAVSNQSIRFVKSPLEYFAECFHESFKGAGTDDERLMALVVSHAEVDLQDIKKVYAEKYGQSLYLAIKQETSGDYRKLLLSIVGE